MFEKFSGTPPVVEEEPHFADQEGGVNIESALTLIAEVQSALEKGGAPKSLLGEVQDKIKVLQKLQSSNASIATSSEVRTALVKLIDLREKLSAKHYAVGAKDMRIAA